MLLYDVLTNVNMEQPSQRPATAAWSDHRFSSCKHTAYTPYQLTHSHIGCVNILVHHSCARTRTLLMFAYSYITHVRVLVHHSCSRTRTSLMRAYSYITHERILGRAYAFSIHISGMSNWMPQCGDKSLLCISDILSVS